MSTAKELGEHLKRLIKELAPQPTPYAFKAIDQLVSLAPAETAAGAPVGWIFEYGAVSLPQGHPARITIRKFFDFEFEAKEEAVGIDYDSVIYPVFASPQPPATHKGAMTEEQINKLASASEVYQYHPGAILEFARAIEQFHGIGIPKESEHG